MATTRTSPASDSGFTLVELLTVLAVLAAVLMVAIPRFGVGGGQPELLAAGQQLAAALRATRTTAMTQGRPAGLTVDLADNGFSGPTDLASGRLPAAIDLSVLTHAGDMVSAQRAVLRFFPDGTSTGGRILLSSEGVTVSVAIQWLTGRVAVERFPD